MRGSALALAVVLSCLIALPLLGGGPEESATFDKVFALAPGGTTAIGVAAGHVTIDTFVVDNPPEPDDVERSKTHPSDGFYPRLVVNYSNSGDRKMKVTITAELTDDGGSVLYRCKSSDTMDPKAQDDHTHLCLLGRMKTAEYLKSTRLHLLVVVQPS